MGPCRACPLFPLGRAAHGEYAMVAWSQHCLNLHCVALTNVLARCVQLGAPRLCDSKPTCAPRPSG
eukprot:13096452-Alexandrium_andersonii.AAC.1